MKKQIRLTDEQIVELNDLQEQVDRAWIDDTPGAIMAQVYPEEGRMSCSFVPNDQVKKMFVVMGMEPPK